MLPIKGGLYVFQSPRSGKFVSNFMAMSAVKKVFLSSFNPLDRGNLYLITNEIYRNPTPKGGVFQSPRSGKFVSNPKL